MRDAEDAIRDMDGREMLGSRIRVQFKLNRAAERGRGEDDFRRNEREVDNSRKPTRSEHRIIIRGLAHGVHWKELKNLLTEKTEPVYVDLRGEGKAVAEFSSAEDISVAIEAFNGQEFKGQVIDITQDETGGDERSDSWQQFDTRPRRGTARGGGGRDGDRDWDSRYRDNGRDRGRDRPRSSSRDRGSRRELRSRSRSRSRGGRRGGGGYDDRRRGERDRSRSRDRSRDRGDGRRGYR